MSVVKFKGRRCIKSRVVKQLVPIGELSTTQREFMVDSFQKLASTLRLGLAGGLDDRALSDLFDAIGVVRDLSVVVLQDPEQVGLCRLELVKQLGSDGIIAG